MAQVYLSTKQADLLAGLVSRWLDSGYEEDEEGVPDNMTQEHIELGVKAINAGSSLYAAHSYVQEAYEKRTKKSVPTRAVPVKPVINIPENAVLYHFSGDSLIVQLPGNQSLANQKHLFSKLAKNGYTMEERSDEKSWWVRAPFEHRNILYGESDLEHKQRYEKFHQLLREEVLEPLSLAYSGLPDNCLKDDQFRFISAF